MPNHITNKIIFYGTKSNIEKVFELIKGEEKVIDFNTLVPMPESIKNTESGTSNDYDIMYYLTEKCTIPYQDCYLKLLNKLVKNRFNDNWLGEVWNRISKQIAEGNPPNYDRGKQLVDNYIKYGTINWHDWSCEYWGTKWNAYDQYVDGNVVYFDTAWTCPFPILDALAELCRKYNVRFEGKWADEDMGCNTGTFSNNCKDCECSCDFCYAEDCSNEAYDIYMECKGTSRCLGKDEQDNWVVYDCETCPHPC